MVVQGCKGSDNENENNNELSKGVRGDVSHACCRKSVAHRDSPAYFFYSDVRYHHTILLLFKAARLDQWRFLSEINYVKQLFLRL